MLHEMLHLTRRLRRSDASIGHWHWGWSFLQYPFIGGSKITLIPRNALPFKFSLAIVGAVPKVDVMFVLYFVEKMTDSENQRRRGTQTSGVVGTIPTYVNLLVLYSTPYMCVRRV